METIDYRRADFEERYGLKPEHRDGDSYIYVTSAMRWETWKAAIDAYLGRQPEGVSDDAVLAARYALMGHSGYDPGDSGYVTDGAVRAALEAYLAHCAGSEAQEKAEPVGSSIATDDDVERVAKAAGWDNRRYMTPADYAVWCARMREFVRLAALPAERVRVPDARIIDLAKRLVASGPKAAHVSASECHEISDFILSLSAAPEADHG